MTVQVTVKKTINQKDKSGKTLEPYIVTGQSFTAILQKLWDKYARHVKARAKHADNGWESVPPTMDEWKEVMQFRFKKHPVESGREEAEWNTWIPSTRGRTVSLLVYEYGMAIATNHDLQEFKKACVDSEETNRGGAASDNVLRSIVEQLRARWERTFRAEDIVWMMWATHIGAMERWNRDGAINGPPPDRVACLLRPASDAAEQQLHGMNRSMKLALSCVNSSIAEYEQIQRDYDALGSRLRLHQASLASRKAIVEAFIRDVVPLSPTNLPDPLLTMENVQDVEHQDIDVVEVEA